MDQGYTVIPNDAGESEFFCPECELEHPRVIEAQKEKEKDEVAREIIAEALWNQAVGKAESKQVKGKKITKGEFKRKLREGRILGR